MSNQLVFVYGTLKKGFSNHNYFLKSSEFVCEAFTTDDFVMIDGVFPYAVRGPHNIEETLLSLGSIKGEVYSVDTPTMNRLRALEGVPDHYQETTEYVFSLESLLCGTGELELKEVSMFTIRWEDIGSAWSYRTREPVKPKTFFINHEDMIDVLEWKGSYRG